MQIKHHGGHCCGIKHLHGFDIDNLVEDKVGLILRTIEDWYLLQNGNLENDGRVIEVTLTDDQITETPSWIPALRHIGFVPVSRFLNSNSDNMVNVFHYHPDGDVTLTLNNIPHLDLPYVPPAPPLPAIVSQTFANVYISGQGIRVFATLAESAVPRSSARRIGVNRLDTYDDGSVVTTRLDNS